MSALLFFIIIINFPIAVLIHEVGHLLFGLIMGFKFSWVSIGKIQLYLDEQQKLKLRFAKQLNSFGGFAAMHTTNDNGFRWRWLIFLLGGVMTNWLSAFIFIFLLDYINPNGFLGLSLSVLAPVSFGLGIFSIIPHRAGKIENDGFMILRFLRGGSKMRRSIAMILLHSSIIEGKGCKQWNPKWIEDSLAIQDNSSTEAIANFFAYDWALDRKEIAKAETHLNRGLELVEKLDPATTTSLYWAQAYFLAIHKHDAVGARAAFEKAGSNPLALAFHPLRSEVAVLFAEGHFEEAKIKAHEGIKVYKESGSPKHGQEELDQLEDILAKAENALVLSSSMVA